VVGSIIDEFFFEYRGEGASHLVLSARTKRKFAVMNRCYQRDIQHFNLAIKEAFSKTGS
jgi:hypothetical protein